MEGNSEGGGHRVLLVLEVGAKGSMEKGDGKPSESLAAYLQGFLTLKDFVWPENQRHSCLWEQHLLDCPSIPKLDLRHPPHQLALEIGRAARDFGVFRLVNHGVPPDLLLRLRLHASRFFALPLPQKMLVGRVAGELTGYNCGNPSYMANKWWNEGLQFEYDPLCRVVPELASKVGLAQAEAAAFQAALADYYKVIVKLAQLLLKLLMIDLGVEPSSTQHTFEDETLSYVRFNHYPPCPQPDLTLGLSAHTDPNPLTILYQDIGGLQVQLKDGKWMSVGVEEGSLLVIVGDILQMWSNDGYKSVMHRATLNSKEPRLTLGFFYYPAAHTVIAPLKETVSEAQPAKYRPATCLEIRMSTFNKYARSKSSTETPLTSLGCYSIRSSDDDAPIAA